MKTTEIGRRRLRSIAHRLTREGDDHTMSGTFGQYYEGDAVEAALDDLETCLALLRTLVRWNDNDDADTDDVLRIAAKAAKLLGPEGSR